MYKNPYDSKTEKDDHDQYWHAYLIGKRDGIFKRKNLFSRRWPFSYRWGYAAGYTEGVALIQGD